MKRFYCLTPFVFSFFLCEKNALAAQDISSFSTGFTENKGQVFNQDHIPNNDVLFLYHGKGFNIQLRKNGYSYDFFEVKNLPAKTEPGNPSALLNTTIGFQRMDVEFAGMNPGTSVMASGVTPGALNYYVCSTRVPAVHSFKTVSYHNIYPGTDIDFFITGNEAEPMKYDIVLRPGARLEAIKFLISGADKITLENNSLILSTGSCSITENIPASYYAGSMQEKQNIFYQLSGHTVTFIGKYDRSRELVIDPSTNRIWGTYYGDAATDYCNGVRCDAQNNVYITGYTLNSTNIATNGTYQSSIGGSYDAYLVKFDAGGSRVWGTYFGGGSVETAYGIFVTAQGYIYICGDTFSTSGVASVGAHQTTYGGGIDDAFLAKFSSSGQLKWSTYYGGTLHDFASRVTVDNNGNVLMCGHSESANNIATNGTYQNFQAGQYDVFVVKFDSLGIRQWGTYYGDANADEAWGITCDNTNAIYVTGFTASASNIATTGSHQPASGGQNDAFIAKFSAAGNSLLWATYYGGSGNDKGSGIAYDNAGNIFIAGNTTSANNISSSGSYQQTPGSADDGFITKFTTTGVRVWGTYFGGNNVDYIDDLTLDTNSDIFVCGSTESTDVISTAGAYQGGLASPNVYDAYFEKFSSAGVRKLGTYYGGSYQDNAHGIAVNSVGHVFISGETYSSDSIASPGAFMTAYTGGGDDFLAKFCVAPEPLITPPGISSHCTGDTIQVSTGPGYSSYSWNNGETVSSFIQPSASNGTFYLTVTVADAYGCSGTSDTATILIDVCNGIMSPGAGINVDIFPVPAGSQLTLDFTGAWETEKEIQLLSAEGKIIFKEKTAADKLIMPLGQLPSGIYILKIKAGEKLIEKKFIKAE